MLSQLIFLGAPGSGKGTQAKRLVAEKGCIQVSTGDLLRLEISKGTALGNRIKTTMSNGSLVDDKTVSELLKINCNPEKAVYIFDGYPRNLEQAKILDKEILSSHPSKALHFEIDLSILKDRLVNRRSCSKCGAIFNLISHAPKNHGKCDLCGGILEQRNDDKEEVVLNRLKIFQGAITPLLSYYKETKRLITIDATGSQDSVYKAVLKAAGLL